MGANQGLLINQGIADTYLRAKAQRQAALDSAQRHQEAQDTLDQHGKELDNIAKRHMEDIKRQTALLKEESLQHYGRLVTSGVLDPGQTQTDTITDSSGNPMVVPRMNSAASVAHQQLQDQLESLKQKAPLELANKVQEASVLGPVNNNNAADYINATATPSARSAAIQQGALAPGIEKAKQGDFQRKMDELRLANEGKTDVQDLRNTGGLQKQGLANQGKSNAGNAKLEDQLNGFARMGSLLDQLHQFSDKYNTSDNPVAQGVDAIGKRTGKYLSQGNKEAVEKENEIKGIQMAIDRGEFGAKGTIPVKLIQQLAGNFPDLSTTKTASKSKIEEIEHTINSNILALTSHMTPEERSVALKAKGINYFKNPSIKDASAFYGKIIHLKDKDGNAIYDGVLSPDIYQKYKAQVDEALSGVK